VNIQVRKISQLTDVEPVTDVLDTSRRELSTDKAKQLKTLAEISLVSQRTYPVCRRRCCSSFRTHRQRVDLSLVHPGHHAPCAAKDGVVEEEESNSDCTPLFIHTLDFLSVLYKCFMGVPGEVHAQARPPISPPSSMQSTAE
jgi:hypothetical protein